MRYVGTVVRGIRCPIIREGDDLTKIVIDSVISASVNEPFAFHDKDVIAITESVVARAQGNYATVDQIAQDVKSKVNGDTIGLVFPILSRNRFAVCLRGIARASKKIILQLSYPSDEVGNQLVSWEQLYKYHVNPYTCHLGLNEYRAYFGKNIHPFTGIDYIDYYKEIIESEGATCEIVFANNPDIKLLNADTVIACDIHTTSQTIKKLKDAGIQSILTLSEIMNCPIGNSGYNPKYGLLGSNKATEEKVKLFPRECTRMVYEIQMKLQALTGHRIEVMVYGDGAFKDPLGQIWEFADPVVSPGYTAGLEGTPNELKIKYLADNEFGNLNGTELREKITQSIQEKDSNLKGQMSSEGTTPRRLTDLIGSLCDLTSGSGDKGTPIVLVQGYFDNFSNEQKSAPKGVTFLIFKVFAICYKKLLMNLFNI